MAELLILKLSFLCVIREIVAEVGFRPDLRMQKTAMCALQEAAESFLVAEFESELIYTDCEIDC